MFNEYHFLEVIPKKVEMLTDVACRQLVVTHFFGYRVCLEKNGANILLGATHFINLLLAVPAIMLATTIHEATRALISTLLGDDTPKREGRLTLNPLSHFEPIGFLLLFSTSLSYGVGIGWGQPVGTNSRHYKNRRAGVVLTAVWPSVANFLFAVIMSNALTIEGMPVLAGNFLHLLLNYNVYLVVCNLIPVSPFDCLKVVNEFVSRKNYFSISQSESVMQLIMILLLFTGLLTAVLNPISRVFFSMVSMLTF